MIILRFYHFSFIIFMILFLYCFNLYIRKMVNLSIYIPILCLFIFLISCYALPNVPEVNVEHLHGYGYHIFSFLVQYFIEIFGFSFIIFYASYFIWGRRKNKKIAKTWLNEYLDLFKEQFTSVGISGENGLFINVSHDEYRFFCSGRVHCRGLCADCKMKKRQDFYSFLVELISPVEDILTIDVPFDPQPAFPFVFALCRKKDARNYYNQFKDLVSSQFIPELSKSSNDFVVYCDNNEIPSQIVNSQLVSLLLKDHDYFRLIHITDTRGDNNDGSILLSTYSLRLKFRIPPYEKISELRPWMEYIFTLIDFLPTLHLSMQSVTNAVKARNQVELKYNHYSYGPISSYVFSF